MKRPYKLYSLFLLLSLVLTLIGSMAGLFLGDIGLGATVILSFVFLILFFVSKGIIKKVAFTLFCLGEGLLLSPFVLLETGYIVPYTLLATFLIVTIFLIIGLKAKDLGFLKGILFIFLIGVVIYRLFCLFLPLPTLSLLVILVFCGYVSYDINRFKNKVNSNEEISIDEILEEVMNIYLNILNIFLEILKLLIENLDIFDIFDI